ncbi:hypothetical protein Tco_0830484 [Tanacetum coccineum]
MLLKKLPKKLGDPGKFLIPCNFPGMDSPSLSNSYKDDLVSRSRDDIEILFSLIRSTLRKSVASILEGFINDPLFKENDDLFDLDCDNDEIDAFLAIEVPMYIEEGYYDSEGDVIYLESLLSDDTTINSLPKEPDVARDKSNVNEDECFDPGGGEINVELTIPSHLLTSDFFRYLTLP